MRRTGLHGRACPEGIGGRPQVRGRPLESDRRARNGSCPWEPKESLSQRDRAFSPATIGRTRRTRQSLLRTATTKWGISERLDEKGNIFITGRKKDIIQRGGEGIIPKQIEDLLEQLPCHRKGGGRRHADPRLGEKACAYVVLKPGSSLSVRRDDRVVEGKGGGRAPPA